MAKVCKLCDCGFLNIYEEHDIAPRRCEQCGRNILQKDTFDYEEYQKQQVEEVQPEVEEKPAVKGLFKLVCEQKGIELILPEDEDFVLGREGVGAEVFGNTISRNHLYVTPRGRLGISVVDKESLNGTKVNDELLAKGVTKIVVHGNTITLDVNDTGVTLTLLRIEQE